MACAEISGPVTLPQYVAIADYSKAQAGEMSITAGSILSIVEKKMTGEHALTYCKKEFSCELTIFVI